MPIVFIAYSRRDVELVGALARTLDDIAAPALTTWYADRDIFISLFLREQILDSIRRSNIFFFIVSKNSIVANNSPFLSEEQRLAVELARIGQLSIYNIITRRSLLPPPHLVDYPTFNLYVQPNEIAWQKTINELVYIILPRPTFHY